MSTRVGTERALRESEERFRLAFEDAPIGMALVALDGRFVRVNAALCQVTGYSADELTHLTFQAITHPDDLDADLAVASQLIRGQVSRYRLAKRYIHKGGRPVDIMLHVSILRDRSGEPLNFIAQVEDISDRKRAEEALRLSEAKFSGIIAISPEAIIAIDEEQHIALFNLGAESIFGYSSAEALGARLDLFLSHGARDVAEFAVGEEMAPKMGAAPLNVTGRRKDGSEFPAEAEISKIEIGGKRLLTAILRDVTDRKRVEQERAFLAKAGVILGSSLDYTQTVKAIADLVVQEIAELCVIDLVDEAGERAHQIATHADPTKQATCAALARTPVKARSEFVSIVIRTRESLVVSDLTSERLAQFSRNGEHLRLLRELNPRSAIGVPLMVGGRLLGALLLGGSRPHRFGQRDLGLVQELAHRAALAIDHARLYKAAQQASQARDEVLGIVAHDLRNPLNAIELAAHVLERHVSETPFSKGKKSIDTIQRSTQRANRLIRDLLDVTQIESGRLAINSQHLPPDRLVLEAVQAQQLLTDSAAIQLKVVLPQGLPRVWGDHDRLLQVLENLIGNATKFTKPNGCITVGAEPEDGQVHFWVADTGEGIAPENLQRVFDRFWQESRGKPQGAGLGLPICKGIVGTHGGHIWSESTLGRGTTFHFQIPTSPPTAELHPELPLSLH